MDLRNFAVFQLIVTASLMALAIIRNSRAPLSLKWHTLTFLFSAFTVIMFIAIWGDYEIGVWINLIALAVWAVGDVLIAITLIERNRCVALEKHDIEQCKKRDESSDRIDLIINTTVPYSSMARPKNKKVVV